MRFAVRVLGTSGAVPAHGRFCSAQVLHTETTDFLLDCGEGCQMQLQRFRIGHSRIHHLFITHLHGDHFYGLPGLLTSWALNGRSEALTIYSPEGLYPMLDALLQISRRPFPFPLRIISIPTDRSECILQTNTLGVYTVPLHHHLPTAGFLFRERPRAVNIRKAAIAEYEIPYQAIAAIKAGADYLRPDGTVIPHSDLIIEPPSARSYAYCTDTRYLPKLAGQLKGVDLLYHEATFLHELVAQAEETLHSTAQEAAQLAAAAGVGQLILGHYSSRYPDEQGHQEEAQRVFPATTAARDGDLFDLPFKSRADRA